MKNNKFLISLCLFILGMSGIVSLFFTETKLPAEVEMMLLEKFSPFQVKLLLKINPLILLLISIIIGINVYKKVELQVPLIESLVNGN